MYGTKSIALKSPQKRSDASRNRTVSEASGEDGASPLSMKPLPASPGTASTSPKVGAVPIAAKGRLNKIKLANTHKGNFAKSFDSRQAPADPEQVDH